MSAAITSRRPHGLVRHLHAHLRAREPARSSHGLFPQLNPNAICRALSRLRPGADCARAPRLSDEGRSDPTSSRRWATWVCWWHAHSLKEWGGIGRSVTHRLCRHGADRAGDQSVAAAWQAHVTIGSLPLYLFGNDAQGRERWYGRSPRGARSAARLDRDQTPDRSPGHPHPADRVRSAGSSTGRKYLHLQAGRT